MYMKYLAVLVEVSFSLRLSYLDSEYGFCQGIDVRELTIPKAQKLQVKNFLSAKHLTECYLQRIEKLSALNAVVELNSDALDIATTLDSKRNLTGALTGALHGIPILLKDNIATGDKMETTAGSLALLGIKPTRDATAVTLLRRAGAIIIGKTNLSELAGFRSDHLPPGWSSRGNTTKSAYRLSSSPYGSSSGSAVAVSANLCMAALGTETDGSIIAPSSFAGVVGLKPTVGLVPMVGIIPIAKSMDSVGPIARSVKDAQIVFSVIADQPKKLLGVPEDLKVGVIRDEVFKYLNNTLPIYNKAIDQLSTIAQIKENITITLLDQVFDQEFLVMKHEFNHYMNLYLKNYVQPNTSTISDIIQFNKLNDPTQPQEILQSIKEYHTITNQTYIITREKIQEFGQKVIYNLLNDNYVDAIAIPSNLFSFTSTPCTLSGYPMITVPVGLNWEGIPFGISFYSTANSEPLLLSLASAFEDITQSRQPPEFLD